MGQWAATWGRFAAILLVLLVSRPTGAAEPANIVEARELYQKATAAYGLGNFAEAALLYEKAFALTTKPELLFNAAQAHRRANNKERALALYTSYLQIFPNGSGRELAERRIDELNKANAGERSPPAITPPSAAALAPAPAPAPAINLTTTPPAEAPRPLYRSPWLWVGVGAVVLASVLTVVALSGTKQPTPTWGTVGTP
jgi:tetratricopeptide (TPR) repeat protein